MRMLCKPFRVHRHSWRAVDYQTHNVKNKPISTDNDVDKYGEKINVRVLALLLCFQVTAKMSFASFCLLIIWPVSTCSKGAFTTAHAIYAIILKLLIDSKISCHSGSASTTGLWFLPPLFCYLPVTYSHFTVSLGFSWFQRYYQCFVQRRAKQRQQSGGKCWVPVFSRIQGTVRLGYVLSPRWESAISAPSAASTSDTAGMETCSERFAVCQRSLFISPHHCSSEINALTVMHMKQHCKDHVTFSYSFYSSMYGIPLRLRLQMALTPIGMWVWVGAALTLLFAALSCTQPPSYKTFSLKHQQ